MHYLVKKSVQSDMKVLELGARYGTVSVCLNYILQDPLKQLLCVDPDKRIEQCLEKNKTVNNCTFNIFNGAISKKDLYVCYNNIGWETKTYETPPEFLQTESIVTKSLDEIMNLLDIQFDCLIADCEGFLLDFLIENKSFFDNLRCVIYEEDCTSTNPINGVSIDYQEIDRFLESNGFLLKETHIDHLVNKV